MSITNCLLNIFCQFFYVGFVGAFYNGFGTKAVAVLPYKNEKPADNSNLPGSGNDYWQRAQKYCALLHNNDWKVPDMEELSLLFLNRNILRSIMITYFWSSIPASGSEKSWQINFNGDYGYGGVHGQADRTTTSLDFPIYVHCIRANALK